MVDGVVTHTVWTVFVDKKVPGVKPLERKVEVPDNYTEIEANAHLQIALDVMISQEIESGWYPNIITDLKG